MHLKVNKIFKLKIDQGRGNFKLNGNQIQKPNFGGKGRYLMPVKISNSNSPSDYKMILNFEFQNLKPNKEYFVDYNLLIAYIFLYYSSLNLNL